MDNERYYQLLEELKQKQMHRAANPANSDDDNWQEEKLAETSHNLDQAASNGLISLDEAERAKAGDPKKTYWDHMMGFEQPSEEMFGTWFQPAIDILSTPLYATHALTMANLGANQKDGNAFNVGPVKLGFSTQAFMDSWRKRQTYGTGGLMDESSGLTRFAADVALDPLTYLTFGIGAGVKVGVKNAVKLGGKEITKEGTNLTLNKHGSEIYQLAARRLKPGIEEKLGLQSARRASEGVDELLHLEHSALRHLHDEVGTYMVDNYDSLVNELIQNRGKLASIAAAPGGAARTAGKLLSDKLDHIPDWSRTAADMFDETASLAHADRGFTSGPGKLAGGLVGGAVAGGLGGVLFGTTGQLVGTALGGAAGYKLATSAYSVHTARLFDPTSGVAKDLTNSYYRTKYAIQKDTTDYQARLEERLSDTTKDEREVLSGILEGTELSFVKKNDDGMIISALHDGGQLPQKLMDHANWVRGEFDDILAQEQKAGFKIESLQDYVSHMYTDPNVRKLQQLKIEAHGGISSGSIQGAGLGKNSFELHRQIATLEEAIEVAGIGNIEKDIGMILSKRKAASIKMRHMESFYDVMKSTAGMPAVMTYNAIKDGKLASLSLKRWLRTMDPKDAKAYLFDQYYSLSDTMGEKLGFNLGHTSWKPYLAGRIKTEFEFGTGRRKQPFEGISPDDSIVALEGKSRSNLSLVRFLSKSLEERNAPSAIGEFAANVNAKSYKQVGRTIKTKIGVEKGEDAKSVDVVTLMDRIYTGDGDVLRAVREMLGKSDLNMQQFSSVMKEMDKWSRKNFEAPLLQMFPDLLYKTEASMRTLSRFSWANGTKLKKKIVDDLAELEKKLSAAVDNKSFSPQLPDEVITRARWWRMRMNDYSDYFAPKGGQYDELDNLRKRLGIDHNHIQNISRALVGEGDISKLSQRDLGRLNDFIGGHVEDHVSGQKLRNRKVLWGENLAVVNFNSRRAPDFGDIEELMDLRRIEEEGLVKNSTRDIKIKRTKMLAGSKQRQVDFLKKNLEQITKQRLSKLSKRGANDQAKIVGTIQQNIKKLEKEITDLRENASKMADEPQAPVSTGAERQTYIGREEFMRANSDVLSDKEQSMFGKRFGFKRKRASISSLTGKAGKKGLASLKRKTSQKMKSHSKTIEKLTKDLLDTEEEITRLETELAGKGIAPEGPPAKSMARAYPTWKDAGKAYPEKSREWRAITSLETLNENQGYGHKGPIETLEEALFEAGWMEAQGMTPTFSLKRKHPRSSLKGLAGRALKTQKAKVENEEAMRKVAKDFGIDWDKAYGEGFEDGGVKAAAGPPGDDWKMVEHDHNVQSRPTGIVRKGESGELSNKEFQEELENVMGETGLTNGQEVTKYLIEHMADESWRLVAERILPFVNDLEINIAKPGKLAPPEIASSSAKGSWRARFDPEFGDVIWVRGADLDDTGVTSRTVLHELIHAATVRRIWDAENKVNRGTDLSLVVEDLEYLLDDFKREVRWTGTGDGLDYIREYIRGVGYKEKSWDEYLDASELITWGLTDYKVQELLKSMKSPLGRQTSAWTKFVKVFLDFFNIPKDHKSGLEDLIGLTDELLALPASGLKKRKWVGTGKETRKTSGPGKRTADAKKWTEKYGLEEWEKAGFSSKNAMKIWVDASEKTDAMNKRMLELEEELADGDIWKDRAEITDEASDKWKALQKEYDKLTDEYSAVWDKAKDKGAEAPDDPRFLPHRRKFAARPPETPKQPKQPEGMLTLGKLEKIRKEKLTKLYNEEKKLEKFVSSLTEDNPIELIGHGKYRVKETGKIHDIISTESGATAGEKRLRFAGNHSEDIEKAIVADNLINGRKHVETYSPVKADDLPQTVLGKDSDMYFFPESIVNMIREIKTPTYNSDYEFVNKFARGYDLVQQAFKIPLLAVWGSTWMRNAIGNVSLAYLRNGIAMFHPERLNDFQKLYQYGLAMEGKDFRIANNITEKMMKDLGQVPVKALGDQYRSGGKPTTIADLYDEMGQRGVLSGIWRHEIGGEFGSTEAVLGKASVPTDRLKGAAMAGAIGASIGGPVGGIGGMAVGALLGNHAASLKAGFKAGELLTELPTRMMLGLNVYKETGSLTSMSDDVRKYLHDYSDLSTFEKRFIRRAIPFYNFVKLATKVTGNSVFDNPGRLVVPWKIFNAQNTTGSLNPFAEPIDNPVQPEDYPDYFHDQMKFAGKDIEEDGSMRTWLVKGFNLPIQEVGHLLDTVMPGGKDIKELGRRGGFGSTALAEWIMNYDTFKMGKIVPDEPGERTRFQSGTPFKASPDWMKQLVQYTEDPEGKATVNPRINWLLQELPTSRFINVSKQIFEMNEEEAKELNYNALAKHTLGISVYKVDPETQTYFVNKAKIDEMEILLSNINSLREYRRTYAVDPETGKSFKKGKKTTQKAKLTDRYGPR